MQCTCILQGLYSNEQNRSMAFALALSYQLYALAHTQQHIHDSVCIFAGASPRAGALAQAKLVKNRHGSSPSSPSNTLEDSRWHINHNKMSPHT